MAALVKGDVVALPFPFSDLSGEKRRPALVLATLSGNDVILCQIISRNRNDKLSIPLSLPDFAAGGLPIESYIRPNRIFTADKNIIIRKAGTLKKEKMKIITEAVVELLII